MKKAIALTALLLFAAVPAFAAPLRLPVLLGCP